MRFATVLLFLIVGTQGCATKLSESAALAILLPDGAVLKGITLRLGKGYFQASSGRLTSTRSLLDLRSAGRVPAQTRR